MYTLPCGITHKSVTFTISKTNTPLWSPHSSLYTNRKFWSVSLRKTTQVWDTEGQVRQLNRKCNFLLKKQGFTLVCFLNLLYPDRLNSNKKKNKGNQYHHCKMKGFKHFRKRPMLKRVKIIQGSNHLVLKSLGLCFISGVNTMLKTGTPPNAREKHLSQDFHLPREKGNLRGSHHWLCFDG